MSDTFNVTQENNFCRVFKLPNEFPEGFCFDGPKSVNFSLVDWFNPVYQDRITNKPYCLKGAELDNLRNSLREFIDTKLYRDPNYEYLILTDYGDAIVIPKR